MKTVFTNSEIVHAFNLQDQPNGRTTNSSMYFEYKKIYSYGSHYLLGEFIDENTIIINDEGYSVTTSKHISLLTNATRDKRQFFKTEIEPEIVINQLKIFLKLLSRTRLKADYYTTTINNLFKNYFEYVDFKKPKKSKEHRQIAKLYKDFIDKAKNIIETSQGVKIPIQEGKRLLKLIDLKKIVGARIDNKYIVNAFNGLLKVGCHNIELKEINNIKKQLCK